MLRGQVTWSAFSIVRSDLDIKFWLDGPPDIHAVRPVVCPCCQAPGGALGERLRLVGHGVRRRELRGPLSPGDQETERVVFARRFRCRSCSAVVLVVPREVAPRRLYAAPAIGSAFARWGVEFEGAAQVEAAVRGALRAGFDGRRWRTLDRWVKGAMEGRLFERLNPRAVEKPATMRTMAGALARQLAAFSRRVRGLIEALAMDGARMAIGVRSQGKPRPPSASTAG